MEVKLEDIQASDFGECGELLVSKDDTLILSGKGKSSKIFFPILYLSNFCFFICAAEDSESFESESSKTQGNILNQTIKPQSVSVLHAYEDLFCH